MVLYYSIIVLLSLAIIIIGSLTSNLLSIFQEGTCTSYWNSQKYLLVHFIGTSLETTLSMHQKPQPCIILASDHNCIIIFLVLSSRFCWLSCNFPFSVFLSESFSISGSRLHHPGPKLHDFHEKVAMHM